MREVGELTGFVDLVARRAERAELFQRLPEGWIEGERGGPSWFAPGDHVREDAPRVYARPTVVAGANGLARMHYADGDPRLRRVSIVLDPFESDAGPTVHDVFSSVAELGRRVGELPCIMSGSLHPHHEGVQLVIDIAAVIPSGPDKPASMEEFFVFYD